jgi:hypothetical protein
MSDDFQKGMMNDTSNVSNFSEFERGRNYQLNANAANDRGASTPHSAGFAFVSNGPAWVITGENPILQFIVSIPFILAGTLLYPLTAIATLIAVLLCVRLVPMFGAGATWERWLAYVPALVVFWCCMRWDIRAGTRNRTYRRGRHAARVLVFAALGYAIASMFAKTRGMTAFMPLGSAVVAAALGHWFLMRSQGWRDFWHRTVARLRLPAE